MRYLPSDKYNVAWFKLAECVARGEKERALGVYRLLSHSFDDLAFTSQLEGDILFSFEDELGAIAKYDQALHLYEKTNRLLEAAAVGEHLVTLAPEKYDSMRKLVDLYKALAMHHRVSMYLQMLFALALGNKDAVAARLVLEELDQYVPITTTLAERQELIFAYVSNATLELEPLFTHIEHVIMGMIEVSNQAGLHHFLTRLELASPISCVHARQYIEKAG